MRKIRLLLLTLGALGAHLGSSAQVIGVEVVPHLVHTGVYADGVNLEGYVTYHVNLLCTDSLDQVSAVYGTDLNPVPDGDADLPDDEDFTIDTYGCLFQHEFGGFTAEAINPGFLPAFPSLEWDSFVTMDKCISSDPGDVYLALAVPATGIIETFEGDTDGDYFDGGNLWIDDGAIFTLAGSPNSECGSDLKFKIAQITTKCDPDDPNCECGPGNVAFDMSFCVQSFIEGSQEPGFIVNECFTTSGVNPCLASPIDPSLTVTSAIDCFGQLATVEIGGGGNGDLTIELFDATDGTSLDITTGTIYADLMEGGYYIAISDEIGCYDTTEVFTFVEPAEMIVTTDFAQDNLCFGEDIAQICVDVVGGTDPVSITGMFGDGSIAAITTGMCFENIPCGLATITVTDDNGCVYTEDFDVTCPEELILDLVATPASCFELCDGTIAGNTVGGTGDVVVQWSGPDGPIIDFTGPLPMDISLADLCEGFYTVTAEDGNGCPATDSFDLLDPEPLATTVTVANIACAGECSGSINIEISGGVGSYITTCDGIEGTSFEDLCAGTYTCITTDENGCEVTDLVDIEEPLPITYTIEVTPLSCSDACVGVIAVNDISGGGGLADWSLSITPASGTVIDGLPTNYQFIDLCADTYDVSITDVPNNCTVTEVGIEIIAPDPLTLEVDVTGVSCFGFNDGMVDVTCTGGTPDVNIIQPAAMPCPGTIEDLAPGTYTIVIEDAQGCEAEETIVIDEPLLLELSITETTTIGCGGDCDATATYVVSGGTDPIALVLNDGVIPDVGTIQGLCAADYVLCALDANACEACVDFNIDEPVPLEILFTFEDVTCTGMCDGFANVFATGGQAPIDLVYETEGLDLNNLCEGTIHVDATDAAGCTTDVDIVIGALTVTDMELTMFSTPETCWETNDGTATAAVTGGFGTVNWIWSDPLGQTTETAIGLASNEEYMVIITDSLGCTLDTTIVVDPNVGCFFVATAITPNGDGYNDEWLIGGLEYFPDAQVQVYNRWGQLLFESMGYDVPWDGRSNGSFVPVADYYFIIKYAETEDPIIGTVTVKY